MLELVIFSSLNGLLYGMLLFLLASGLTLIFSMMGVLNFAHASFYMLGAYFGYQISRYVGYWPGLVLAPILVGFAGALIERFGLRTVHKFGHVAELLFTFGLAFIIEEGVQMIWGKVAVDYRVPELLNFPAFTLFETTFPAFKMFMLVVSVATFVALLTLLTKTRVGLIIQAALSHPNTVGMLGHNVPLIFMMVFGFGCGLAALAGVIASCLTTLLSFGLLAFCSMPALSWLGTTLSFGILVSFLLTPLALTAPAPGATDADRSAR